MRVPFVKMHGLGNDFVVFDELAGGSLPLDSERARRICDRRLGVGCDQILWLRKPRDPSCDARMEILNADGSVAEMCGNGIRAVALYLAREKGARAEFTPGELRPGQFRIETLAGIKTVALEGERVRVDMGAPELGGGFAGCAGEELMLPGGGPALRFFEVGMGNPHAVIFVDSFEGISVAELGPRIETHRRFPARTNVEFVRVVEGREGLARAGSREAPRAIEVHVWERGAGITLACGTGACAAAVASLATGKVRGPVEVRLPGGSLEIDWAGEGRPVLMTGPAVEVFRGMLEI